MKLSQRESVLRSLAPGHLVYLRTAGCHKGVYQFGGVSYANPVLINNDGVVVVDWKELFPPF